MIRYYLGEDADPRQRRDVPARGARRVRVGARAPRPLVVKPVDGSGGYGLVIGPSRDRRDADGAPRRRCCATHGDGSRRSPIALSTSPTLRRRPDGAAAPRPATVRGQRRRSIWVVPGGLTRVALPEGSLVVNSSQGGGSKDTWVLATAEDGPVPTQGPAANGSDLAPAPAPAAQAPTLGPLPAHDAQQQQQ